METSTRQGESLNAACCAPELDPSAERLADLEAGAKMFRALADETRLAILRQLRDQNEVCACDFVACCAVAQPTVSHHLKVLRAAGLVTAEKRGLWVYYRLDPTGGTRLRALLP